MIRFSALFAAFAAAVASPAVRAAAVTPQLGGGSPGGTPAAMKHADVYLDTFGVPGVTIEVDASVATPRLRPLLPGDSFADPAADAVLAGKAYNSQYGWNPGGFIRLPAGSAFWVELLGSSPGLEVYQAAPESPAYEPILGAGGADSLWKWSTTRMVHNHYAAENWMTADHWARYRVYVGDASSGIATPGYTPDEVTFWFARPGDFNSDGAVNAADHSAWIAGFGSSGTTLDADANGDGVVDAADYTVWRDRATAGGAAATVPSPPAAVLATTALVSRRSRRACPR
ncbi:MAG: dockerin type I repeat-containing protein [Planctomycetota bacterium]